MTELRVYVSGLYSGPNPSPGLGVARSLRVAYPRAILVGVDYSSRSSGLHWPEFDEIWLQRPWDELHLGEYARQIRGILDSGALWVSGLDLETIWLAQAVRAHPNLLAPRAESLRTVAKPAVEAAEALGLGVPPFVHLSGSDWDLHAFCRRHDWKVWLKGPYYEARRVAQWSDVGEARAELAQTWAVTSELFLQAHVPGNEESIVLSALRGRLLGCARMVKREVTAEGKTWAGGVSAVPADLLQALAQFVEIVGWTGGAELEMVRDAAGAPWVLEWNPRFPAWIYGATLCGWNLPALLVEAAVGVPAAPSVASAREFVRVVLEVPTRTGFPVSPLPETSADGFRPASKHPSGMALLARRLGARRDVETVREAPEVPRSMLFDLRSIDERTVPTPSAVLLQRTTAESFERVASAVSHVRTECTQVRAAYSIKTNPDAALLRLARQNGFLAEAISQMEVQKALSQGFAAEDIVLNGPGKWWPATSEPVVGGAVFVDSVGEMEHLLERFRNGLPVPRIVGVRLRPPGVSSRFGVDLADYETFERLVTTLALLPSDVMLGAHFHVPSSMIGTQHWWSLYNATLRWCGVLEANANVSVGCFDIGGGWFPDDFARDLVPSLQAAVERACARLPRLRLFVLEPGKAVVQPCLAVIVRVLEVRRLAEGAAEIVVDGSIAELPEARSYPHRVLALRPADGEWEALRGGEDRVLGRLCMEDDVLATRVSLPHRLQRGSLLALCDAGAYDRSMSFQFARG